MSEKLPERKENEGGRTPLSLFDPFTHLRKEIDDIFSDYGRGWSNFFRRPMSLSKFALNPQTDITESKEAFEISVELPGLDEKDVTLTLQDDVLILKGEKKEEKVEKEKDYHLTERSYGAFQRSFTLPPNVDADAIQADFHKGVMTIVLPKTAEAQEKVKTIKIKSR
tara:strand:- start:5097 stop:5597 length:501 start_codon:yes stop_codon:yes gene_type:complete